jgi:predicted kinase
VNRRAPVPGSWTAEPLPIPANALVILVGASGSGKSWWAERWFRRSEVVSSDRCRLLVADDEADQSVNREAFAVFYEIIRRRTGLGRLTVADSTGLQPFSRDRLRRIGRRSGVPVHVVVFCAPLLQLVRNDASRARRVPGEVLRRHARLLAELVDEGALEAEGYDRVDYFAGPEYPPPVRIDPVAIVDSAAELASARGADRG